MNIDLRKARLSYPHLFVPQPPMPGSGPDAKPKYNARFLLTEEDRAAVDTAIQGLLKEKYPKGVPKAFTPDRLCLRLDPEMESWYVAATNENAPKVVDQGRQLLSNGSEIPYAGCYVNARVRLWIQDNDFGKRVNASLEAVQFVKDGERLGHKPVDVNEAFPDLSDEEDVPF